MVNGAIAANATRTDPTEIAVYLDAVLDVMVDIDAIGMNDALTDGIIIIRYWFDLPSGIRFRYANRTCLTLRRSSIFLPAWVE